jgi:hypothetical protein
MFTPPPAYSSDVHESYPWGLDADLCLSFNAPLSGVCFRPSGTGGPPAGTAWAIPDKHTLLLRTLSAGRQPVAARPAE